MKVLNGKELRFKFEEHSILILNEYKYNVVVKILVNMLCTNNSVVPSLLNRSFISLKIYSIIL